MRPIDPLMIEHRLIEQLIAILDNHVQTIADVKQINLTLIDRGIQFLRKYADHCHHGKEEDFLFSALHEKSTSVELQRLLNELEDEHRAIRDMIAHLERVWEKATAGDTNACYDIVKLVKKIASLYPRHIEKEDKAFFILAMEYFSPYETNDMLHKFFESDQRLLYEHYYTLVHNMAETAQLHDDNTSEPEIIPLNDPAVYQCTVCGFIYDPAEGDIENDIPAGTSFDDLSDTWICPLCGVGKEMFNKVETILIPEAIKPHKFIKEYRSDDLVIYWCPQDCSHSGKCWQMLPDVFDLEKRPWVNIFGSSPEDIIRTIDKCPSRALQYSLPPSSMVDPHIAQGSGAKDYKVDLDDAGQIRVIKDGPLLVEAPLRIIDSNGEIIEEGDRFVLCRCGKTKNPPFCDGAHIPGK